MRAKYFIFGYILILCAYLSACKQLSPVRIETYNGEYFQLMLGNPGSTYMLRIDRTSNETLTLFSLPNGKGSKTFSYIDGTIYGGELAYIGCNAVWLPVSYNPSAYTSSAIMSHQGVIGLGPRSHIWKYWHKITYSTGSITLGEYDWSVVRTRYRPFEMSFSYEHPTKCVVGVEEYELQYDPEQEITLLPHDLYYSKDSLLLDFEEKHLILELDEHDFSTKLPSGFQRDALRKQRKGTNQIVLGKHSLKNTVTHENCATNYKILRPGYNLFSMGNSKPIVDSISALVLLLTIVLWLSLAYNNDSKLYHISRKVVTVCELYSLVVTALVVWMEHRGFHSVRYFHYHLAYYDLDKDFYTSSPYALFWSAFVIMWVCSAVSIWLFRFSYHCMHLRKALIESLLFMAFWLTQLDKHGFYEHLIILIVACFYAVLRFVAAMNVYTSICMRNREEVVSPKQLFMYITVFVVFMWSTYFVFYCGFFPFLRRFWYNYPHEEASSVYLYVLFVGIPSVLVYMNYHIDTARTLLLQYYACSKKHIHK